MSNLSLLSSTSRVEVPFVKVTIGSYTFGVYEKIIKEQGIDEYGKVTTLNHIKYPNYIKSLDITKVNGQVNQYELTMEYTVRENDDPNFLEKVFSSVSKSRKIIFSYGDLSMPFYCYKDEEALITEIKSDFTISSSKITYKVSAISSGKLLSFGSCSYFPARYQTQPSTVIKEELLNNPSLGILDIFYGMKNGLTLNGENLIPENDRPKNLEVKTNISVLDYLRYLVNEMTPQDSEDVQKGSIYSLIISDDTSGELQGPYFKIVQTNVKVDKSEAYEIDIGYQSKDAIFDFHIDNDENFSLLYNYSNSLNEEKFVRRLNSRGEIEEVYAPIISSGNEMYKTREEDKSWWTKVTSYPIKSSITIKGLLRPSVLMTHVRLNVYFYGKKHLASGLYMVTKEQDSVSENGFKTTLNLVRVDGDNSSQTII